MAEYDYTYLCQCDENVKFIEESQKKHYNSRPLNYYNYERAIVLPRKRGEEWGLGGVLDQDGSFISLSENSGGQNQSSRFGGAYAITEELEIIDKTVIYIGPIKNHWGHLLVDCISRIWACLLPENIQFDIVYIKMDMEIEEKYTDVLQLAGVNRERLTTIDVPTRFNNVIIPEQSYIPGTCWTKEYKETIDRIIIGAENHFFYNNQNNSCFDRIYLSRTKWNIPVQFAEYGENEIERLFMQNGYKVIYPEKIALPELIYHISNAKEIGTSMGTNFHACALFGHKANRLICLNKRYIHVPHQVVLNELFNHKIIYIDVYYSRTLGIYWIGINKRLRRFVEDNGWDISGIKIIRAYITNGFLYNKKMIGSNIRKSIRFIKQCISR